MGKNTGGEVVKKIMSKEDYFYWRGKLSAFDDFSDGAWWAACEHSIGGYDKMMAWLEAGKIYDKEQEKTHEK